jgi:hypothetical protein
MGSYSFWGIIEFFYYICFALFVALLALIGFGRRNHVTPNRHLRRSFFLLSLSVLSWQAILFFEVRALPPIPMLWIGRLSFAVVAVAVYFAWRFVRTIPPESSRPRSWGTVLMAWETGVLAAITLITPLIDADEVLTGGRAITVFGPLFPLYLLHILVYLALSITTTFRERSRTPNRTLRAQLSLAGYGLMGTGTVALTTNAALPYFAGNFRLCDIGGVSILIFLMSVSYATLVKGLFDSRYVIRETLVNGVLLAFVLGAYASGVFVISQLLTDSTSRLVQFVVLFIAFSVDPLRRFLEQKVDRLLFGERRGGDTDRSKRQRKGTRHSGSYWSLAVLFPWRRQ